MAAVVVLFLLAQDQQGYTYPSRVGWAFRAPQLVQLCVFKNRVSGVRVCGCRAPKLGDTRKHITHTHWDLGADSLLRFMAMYNLLSSPLVFVGFPFRISTPFYLFYLLIFFLLIQNVNTLHTRPFP